VTTMSSHPVSVYGDEEGREVFSEYSVSNGGVRIGFDSPDIQVAEEVVVPREVEVETRVNPLPSYPPEYEIDVLGARAGTDPADIEECKREAVEAGRISTHWPRTPVLGSPRSPVVDEADS